MSLITRTILNTDYYFLPSNAIHIYPCAYRGVDSQNKIFDPEARIQSEHNLTHMGISQLNRQSTYVLQWPSRANNATEEQKRFIANIEGYLIEIDDPDFYNDFAGKYVYLNLVTTNTAEIKSKRLGSCLYIYDEQAKQWVISATDSLDYKAAQNDFIFTGLMLSNYNSISITHPAKDSLTFGGRLVNKVNESAVANYTYNMLAFGHESDEDGSTLVLDERLLVNYSTTFENAVTGTSFTGTSFNGSLNGNATSATQLKTGRQLTVDLGKTMVGDNDKFDGTKDLELSVKGTLPVSCGGTGVINLTDFKSDIATTKSFTLKAANAVGSVAEVGCVSGINLNNNGKFIKILSDDNTTGGKRVMYRFGQKLGLYCQALGTSTYKNLTYSGDPTIELDGTSGNVTAKTIKAGPYNTNQYVTINDGIVSAASYTATSDIRKKENITDFEGVAGSILDLPVKRFDFIDGKKNNIGCIAQDLQKICPELVHEDDDGYLSIEETKLIYLLLEEVKALKQRVDELENK